MKKFEIIVSRQIGEKHIVEAKSEAEAKEIFNFYGGEFVDSWDVEHNIIEINETA